MRPERLYVGWVRSHWTHWEPVTLPPQELLDVALRLASHQSADPADGEKLILPEREKPTGECHL